MFGKEKGRKTRSVLGRGVEGRRVSGKGNGILSLERGTALRGRMLRPDRGASRNLWSSRCRFRIQMLKEGRALLSPEGKVAGIAKRGRCGRRYWLPTYSRSQSGEKKIGGGPLRKKRARKRKRPTLDCRGVDLGEEGGGSNCRRNSAALEKKGRNFGRQGTDERFGEKRQEEKQPGGGGR